MKLDFLMLLYVILLQPHFDASLITKVRALSKHVKADTKKICNRFISQVENRLEDLKIVHLIFLFSAMMPLYIRAIFSDSVLVT